MVGASRVYILTTVHGEKNKCSSSGSLSRFKIHTEGDDGKEYAQYISLYQYTSIL